MPRGAKKKLTHSELTQLLHDVHNYGVNIHSREIFLSGYEGDSQEADPGVDYRSAATFLRNFSMLENLGRSKIVIHMQIDGGCWSNGLAVFDAIRAAKSQTTILAYAQASSMSGVVFQAADHRIMMPNTHFMLHYGSIGFESTSQAASEAVRFNDKECVKMLRIFAERAVAGPWFRSKRWGIKRVSEYLDREMRDKGDWYLSAEEAIEMGLADCILGVGGCKI
jgi:ATP-dependent Clp protease, protease subunit